MGEALENFKSGVKPILVATAVAAEVLTSVALRLSSTMIFLVKLTNMFTELAELVVLEILVVQFHWLTKLRMLMLSRKLLAFVFNLQLRFLTGSMKWLRMQQVEMMGELLLMEVELLMKRKNGDCNVMFFKFLKLFSYHVLLL